jgi:hypothetical protein
VENRRNGKHYPVVFERADAAEPSTHADCGDDGSVDIGSRVPPAANPDHLAMRDEGGDDFRGEPVLLEFSSRGDPSQSCDESG